MSRPANGRSSSGRFLALPFAVIQSDAFATLRGSSVKLLVALASQYNGRNNGDLTAAFKVMRPYGFTSKGTIQRAIDELLEAGFIIKTRHGRFMNPGGTCDLYAIAWQGIDECPGKDLEVKPTRQPPMLFLRPEKQNAQSQNGTRLAPKTGATATKSRQKTNVIALKTGATEQARPVSKQGSY